MLTGTGYVLSPNYPSTYFNNANCTWFLQSDAGKSISLRFEFFELERNFDFINVIYAIHLIVKYFNFTQFFF